MRQCLSVKKAFKAIYDNLPFKQSLFEIVKKVWQPPSYIYRHLHFKGIFEVQVGSTKRFKIRHYGYEIENELFWNGIEGGWEKVSTELWTHLCKSAEVIVDIGANTGVYSLVAKAVNPSAKVYAFEPVQRVFEKLQENIRINNYDVVCIKKAASYYTGKAVIYDTDEEHVYSVTVNEDLSPASVTVYPTEIETITLEEFIEAFKLKRIDLMKIDVETHEPEVLIGLGTYLKSFQPTMLVEILNDDVGYKINQLVGEMDYLFFNINENQGIRQVEKIEHSDYYNFLLCTSEIAKELKLIE